MSEEKLTDEQLLAIALDSIAHYKGHGFWMNPYTEPDLIQQVYKSVDDGLTEWVDRKKYRFGLLRQFLGESAIGYFIPGLAVDVLKLTEKGKETYEKLLAEDKIPSYHTTVAFA